MMYQTLFTGTLTLGIGGQNLTPASVCQFESLWTPFLRIRAARMVSSESPSRARGSLTIEPRPQPILDGPSEL